MGFLTLNNSLDYFGFFVDLDSLTKLRFLMNCGSLFHDRFLYFEWFTYSGMNFYPSLIHFRAVESFKTSDSLL